MGFRPSMPVKKQKAYACKANKARSCMPEICFLKDERHIIYYNF
jgi:hypothetical protein